MALLLLGLFLPALQLKFKIFDEQELKGSYRKREKIPFTVQAWSDAAFQDSLTGWMNDKMGFRPFMVRLRNQLLWFSDKKTFVKNVVVGKQNYLYEQAYIDAYLGRDVKSKEQVEAICRRLKLAQDSLAQSGIPLLVVLAPGKASFFPEYLPQQYDGVKSGLTNYDLFSAALQQQKINTIDFRKWFLNQKEKSKYPLYPSAGIHWSNYGSWLVMDSLIRFYEDYFKSDLISLIMSEPVFSDTLQSPDNDILEAMNLLNPPSYTRMAYPRVSWEDASGKVKPRLYAVGDSYFWQLFNNGFSQIVFSDTRFNYYSRKEYLMTQGGALVEKDFSADEFSLTSTHTQLEAKIRNSKEMMKMIEKKALQKGIPVDSMIRLDAQWLLERERNAVLFVVTEANLKDFPWGFDRRLEEILNLNGVKKNRQQAIEEYEKKIRSSPEMMKMMETKAKQRGIGLDSMIRMDARWLLDEELKSE